MASPHEVRIGLIGFGTVGSAFGRVIVERGAAIEARHGVRLAVAQVAVSRPELRLAALEAAGLAAVPIHADAGRLAADPALDVVVEATGAPTASGWLLAAHRRGGWVVSANKQALAADPELLRLLAAHDPRLLCEAAAAGALPIVRALRESLAADEVLSMRGVLNGTTTFVLARLEGGAGLAESVAEAQRRGYAEPDPSYDLNGLDAAAKLAILCTLAWRAPVRPADVSVTGLGPDAPDLVRRARGRGARVRLVAWARAGARPAVAPIALDPADPLAAGAGVENVIQVEAAVAGTLTWRAPGAGGRETASALLADVVAAARALAAERAPAPPAPAAARRAAENAVGPASGNVAGVWP